MLNLDIADSNGTGNNGHRFAMAGRSLSWRSALDRLQKGGVVPDDRTPEEELELIDQDEVGHDDEIATTLPPTASGQMVSSRPILGVGVGSSSRP